MPVEHLTCLCADAKPCSCVAVSLCGFVGSLLTAVNSSVMRLNTNSNVRLITSPISWRLSAACSPMHHPYITELWGPFPPEYYCQVTSSRSPCVYQCWSECSTRLCVCALHFYPLQMEDLSFLLVVGSVRTTTYCFSINNSFKPLQASIKQTIKWGSCVFNKSMYCLWIIDTLALRR